MRVIQYPDGLLINDEFPHCLSLIQRYSSHIPLILTDPPYGGIVKDRWDNVHSDDVSFANWLTNCISVCQSLQKDGYSLYFWGSIGKPKARHLFETIINVEKTTDYLAKNIITWSKKRGIGTPTNYLFTREELVWLVKSSTGVDKTCVSGVKPAVFNVPYTDEIRKCKPFKAGYECKSPYKRRTNIWNDVSDLFPHEYHACEKPVKLYEIPILAGSNEGDCVLDPFAGSATCAIACLQNKRRFVCIEKDENIFEKAKERLDTYYGAT